MAVGAHASMMASRLGSVGLPRAAQHLHIPAATSPPIHPPACPSRFRTLSFYGLFDYEFRLEDSDCA